MLLKIHSGLFCTVHFYHFILWIINALWHIWRQLLSTSQYNNSCTMNRLWLLWYELEIAVVYLFPGTTGWGEMRRASGARYAIAFKMALLSLVCLPQVPTRAALDLESTSPQADPGPTANSKLPTTPSPSSTNTAQSPVLHRTENLNSETWTPDAVVVVPTTKDGDDRGLVVSHSPRTTTEVAKTDNKIAVVGQECSIKVNRCDNVMVRKQGMCGCPQLNAKKVQKSGLKRSVLTNKYRPQLNWMFQTIFTLDVA